jgi:hypothetical protein
VFSPLLSRLPDPWTHGAGWRVCCIRSCRPFCSGQLGSMCSCRMPSRNHHIHKRLSPAAPGWRTPRYRCPWLGAVHISETRPPAPLWLTRRRPSGPRGSAANNGCRRRESSGIPTLSFATVKPACVVRTPHWMGSLRWAKG